MIPVRPLALALALLLPCALAAVDAHFVGYVGNSGTAEAPVLNRWDPSQPHYRSDRAGIMRYNGPRYNDLSIGPAWVEETGTLYAMAGYGRINAYTLDGRAVGHWVMPKRYGVSPWHRPRLNRTGDYILIYTGNRHDKRIYKLRIGAPEGASPEPVEAAGSDVRTISTEARDGKALVLKSGGRVFSYDPSNDALEPLGTIEDKDVGLLGWTPDGGMMCEFVPNQVQRYTISGGAIEPAGERVKLWGNGWTISGDHLYTCNGGSLFRYAYPSLSADPGVVFGGASGSFIGTVKMNREMDASCGIVEVKDGLFAIASGNSKIIHFAEWDDAKQKFELVRRVGAMPFVRTMLVDASGTVMVNNRVWNWTDDALSPVANSFTGYNYQSVELGKGVVLNFFIAYDHRGKAQVFETKSSTLAKSDTAKGIWHRELAIPADPVGSLAYDRDGELAAMLLDASGAATSYPLNGNGEVHKDRQEALSIRLTKGGEVFSAIVGIDQATALAAVDGALVELRYAGGAWTEQARWKPGFEPGCKLAYSDGRVFVTEKDKGLLSICDLKQRSVVTTVALDAPTAVAANGDRLIVYEEANQRVLKFELRD